MRSAIVVLFVDFVAQTCARELPAQHSSTPKDLANGLIDKLADKLVDKLFGQALKSRPQHNAALPWAGPSFRHTLPRASGSAPSSAVSQWLMCVRSHGTLKTHPILSSRAKMNSVAVKAAPVDLVDKVKKNFPAESIVVIKYGGHAMENPEAAKLFCEDVAEISRCGILPVIVHGGGPMIKAMLSKLDVESKFVDGLRVTDPKTMEVVQMVLCGTVNKNIVASISAQPGVRGAVGLAGMDGCLIQAEPISDSLGQVGSPTQVNSDLLKDILDIKMIPVIAPVGVKKTATEEAADCIPLNINADTAAGAVAKALNAKSFLLMTDITGVLDKDKNLIESMTSNAFETFKADGTITGGMIPKLETAAQAVNAGVGEVSILDGRERHALLKALSGEKFGTKIKP